MIKIYHNPRCSKSRQGLNVLEQSGQPFEIIKYLDTPITSEALQEIITLLEIPPEKLVRKNEAIWKEQYKGKSLSDKEVIAAMVAHPKLIERPIVVNGKKAVIGRPTELISSIL